MPEVYMNSAELAETALNLCSMAPHTFGGIVFKNATRMLWLHRNGLYTGVPVPSVVTTRSEFEGLG